MSRATPRFDMPTEAAVPGVLQRAQVADQIAAPSAFWRTLSKPPLRTRLPEGLDVLWDAAAARLVTTLPRGRRYMRRALAVLALDPEMGAMTQPELDEEIDVVRSVFRRGRETSADVIRGFALVREAAHRSTGMKAYHTQVAAALAMHDGCIAEVATGEGKTLIATLPATVLGWSGRGCHVITVNDYLAERDADIMRPVYTACGLSVAHVNGDMKPPERKAGYAADVTYTTNKEAAADYLRDRLALGRVTGLTSMMLDRLESGRGLAGGGAAGLVMRGLENVVIDEADSVLIDEAVTPLIISGISPNAQQVEAFVEAAALAKQLTLRTHYTVDRQHRDLRLTSAGEQRIEALTDAMGGVWAGLRRAEELVVQALTAKELYVQGVQYVIQEDKVVIVDEATGRLMPDREWRDGLHQAVSAKEGLAVEPPKDTLARVSFQRFFRMYRRLSGMTGTAWEERRELWQTYGTPTAPIPTHRPIQRTLAPDRELPSEQAKWEAVADAVEAGHATGRPVLVGTRTVGASETLSALLTERNVPHAVLNAVRHKEEAQVVAEAGMVGRVTIATNMAGRGTDIKLGPRVKELGGLMVIATERNETRRVDRQLFGRAGRQGDPGSAETYVSPEDELIRQHSRLAWLPKRFWRAQQRAQGRARSQRRGVLKQDEQTADSLGFTGVE